ncbi:unnamed protein product [Adineta steineri]|uniref:Uncharacterized protein n=1 Tax=Adineta steineri TaxID=433720 RepID=A0A815TFS6_9BILA|nr:unnamed protein product [Adineta steineri]CAF1502402.1 unnamed protein product [Adineta steineri]CAF3979138.1 unnamed protein product [Adineta steineri]CAF4049981.1 unnamed protein product [Adineta steineri]
MIAANDSHIDNDEDSEASVTIESQISFNGTEDITIELISFGHSFGVPQNIDLLYSVRHFPTINVENYQ